MSDIIENFIKEMISETESEAVEIQRNELASQFNCVPSQINYVLSTRFTPAQGYLVESKRGGGGFVRIVCLSLDDDNDIRHILAETIGDSINQNEAEGLLDYLYQQGFLEERENWILKTMLKDRVLGKEKKSRDSLRASLLQHALGAICQ